MFVECIKVDGEADMRSLKVMIIDFCNSMHGQVIHWLLSDTKNLYKYEIYNESVYKMDLLFTIDKFHPNYLIILPETKKLIPDEFYLQLKLIVPIPDIIFLEESEPDQSLASYKEDSTNNDLYDYERNINFVIEEHKKQVDDIQRANKDFNAIFTSIYKNKKTDNKLAKEISLKHINNSFSESKNSIENDKFNDKLKINFLNFIYVKYPVCLGNTLSYYIDLLPKRTSFERYAIGLDFFLQLQLSSPFTSHLYRKVLLRHILWYIFYHHKEQISLKNLSEIMGYKDSYLSGQFSATMGAGLLATINKLRISRARDTLLSSNMSIGEIAKDYGYESTAYFSNVFASMLGVSPKMYRQKYHSFLNEKRAKHNLGIVLQILIRLSPKEAKDRLGNLISFISTKFNSDDYERLNINWNKIFCRSSTNFDECELKNFLKVTKGYKDKGVSEKLKFNQTIGKSLNNSDFYSIYAKNTLNKKNNNQQNEEFGQVFNQQTTRRKDEILSSEVYFVNMLISFMRWDISCELSSELLHCLYIFLYKVTRYADFKDYCIDDDFILDAKVLMRLQVIICSLSARFADCLPTNKWEKDDVRLTGIDVEEFVTLTKKEKIKNKNSFAEEMEFFLEKIYSSGKGKKSVGHKDKVVSQENTNIKEAFFNRSEVENVSADKEMYANQYKLNVDCESVARYIYDYLQDIPLTNQINEFQHLKIFKRVFQEKAKEKDNEKSFMSIFSDSSSKKQAKLIRDEELKDVLYRRAFDLPHLRRNLSFGIEGSIRRRVINNLKVILAMAGIFLEIDDVVIDKIIFSV